MTISTAQYLAMRSQLRAYLSGGGSYSASLGNPSDAELNSIVNQLVTDSSGTGVAANVAAGCASAARSKLGGALASALNPSDQDVTDFLAQLKTDASGASAPAAARYGYAKDLLRALLTSNTPGVPNPSLADVLGYIANGSSGGGGGPTGTDYGALAVSNGLTVIGYYRADYAASITGTSGTGKASWAPISGAASAITPDGSATNGIGSVTAGLNGRAGLIQNGATQKGAWTAPALAAPNTTNFHRYWIARQASAGLSGATREAWFETGGVYKVELASSTTIYAYGAGPAGSPAVQNDVWQRGRISYTGSTTGEFRLGNVIVTGGTGATTAPSTARFFGDLLLNWEWLMMMEVTGTLANFHTFATAADTAAQTDWTSAVQI